MILRSFLFLDWPFAYVFVDDVQDMLLVIKNFQHGRACLCQLVNHQFTALDVGLQSEKQKLSLTFRISVKFEVCKFKLFFIINLQKDKINPI